MVGDEQPLTAREWVDLPGPTKKRTRAQRWDLLRNWVLGNGLLDSLPDTHGMSAGEKAQDCKRPGDSDENIPCNKMVRVVQTSA
jgi:hypothetical protein